MEVAKTGTVSSHSQRHDREVTASRERTHTFRGCSWIAILDCSFLGNDDDKPEIEMNEEEKIRKLMLITGGGRQCDEYSYVWADCGLA